MSVRVLICLFLAVAAAGCGGSDDRIDTFPARGQVLWEGQPLSGALVVLHPQNASDPISLSARAETDDQGQFVLGTYDSEDGVPAGQYRITVHVHRLQKAGESFEPGPDLMPAKYSDPAQTELTASIAAGDNQIPLLNLRR